MSKESVSQSVLSNQVGVEHKLAYTINEFCKLHNISRTKFYDIDKSGYGPETISVGRHRLISIEAAKTWREKMSKLNGGSVK